jgi:hypothetical protein
MNIVKQYVEDKIVHEGLASIGASLVRGGKSMITGFSLVGLLADKLIFGTLGATWNMVFDNFKECNKKFLYSKDPRGNTYCRLKYSERLLGLSRQALTDCGKIKKDPLKQHKCKEKMENEISKWQENARTYKALTRQVRVQTAGTYTK